MRTLNRLTIDDVVALYCKKKPRPKVTVAKLNRDMVLIEGTATGLEFLGQYLLAHSRSEPGNCHYWLSPKGPGSAWFTTDSTLGVYLHKLPCGDGKILTKKKTAKKVASKEAG